MSDKQYVSDKQIGGILAIVKICKLTEGFRRICSELFRLHHSKEYCWPPFSWIRTYLPFCRWDRFLTKDELAKLLKEAAPHIERFIKIAIHTGRRKTAITRLKWHPSLYNGWVDLENGVIHFLGKAESETKKRKGAVKIPEKLLKEMQTWDQDGGYVISHKGKPILRIDKAFKAAVKRAGLTDVTPHTLKHTAVTWAFQHGMTLEDATAYFATSRETLENVYRSYSPDVLKRAAKVMNLEL